MDSKTFIVVVICGIIAGIGCPRIISGLEGKSEPNNKKEQIQIGDCFHKLGERSQFKVNRMTKNYIEIIDIFNNLKMIPKNELNYEYYKKESCKF